MVQATYFAILLFEHTKETLNHENVFNSQEFYN